MSGPGLPLHASSAPGRKASPREAWRASCNDYLSQRTGTYEFRCRRYDAVATVLDHLGVQEWDVLFDCGAGMAEFDRRLRERGTHLRYVPVDGCIDGTDLHVWSAPPADFFTAIEVVEHLPDPEGFVHKLVRSARKGVVITTPNAARVDVLGMDPTHRHALTQLDLYEWGAARVTPCQLFNTFDDTLVAVWR